MIDLTSSLADWRSRDNALYEISETALIEAEKLLKKNLNSYNKKIQTGFNNPLFLLLKPIADLKVKYYQADFYRHDNIILQDNPDKFIWIVRDAGTWLLIKQSDFAQNIITSYGDKEDYYFYDNGNLIKSDKTNIINYYHKLSL
jgi:hypothetical protein